MNPAGPALCLLRKIKPVNSNNIILQRFGLRQSLNWKHYSSVFMLCLAFNTAHTITTSDNNTLENFRANPAIKNISFSKDNALNKVVILNVRLDDVFVKFRKGTSAADIELSLTNAGSRQLATVDLNGWQHVRGLHGQTSDQLLKVFLRDPNIIGVWRVIPPNL